MNPIIKVYSHPRSGTNYLLALMKKNFYSEQNTNTYGGWGHWTGATPFDGPVVYGKISGNHEIPLDWEKFVKACNKIPIYIYRDGRAVALSVWKSKGFLNPTMRNLSFSDFIRTNLDWANAPSRKVAPERWKNVIKQWYDHVFVWTLAAKKFDIMLVSYEELLKNPEQIVRQICNKYNLEWSGLFVPELDKVGPSPNEVDVIAWKKHFLPQDLDYFFSIVPQSCSFLQKEVN